MPKREREIPWRGVKSVKVEICCAQETPDLRQRVEAIVKRHGYYINTNCRKQSRPPAPEGVETASPCVTFWIQPEHLKELETELGNLEDEGVSYTVTKAKTQYGEQWELEPGELPEKESPAEGANKFGFLEAEWTRTDPDEAREHTREAKRAVREGARTYRGMALGVRSDHLYRDGNSTTRVTGQVHEDRKLDVTKTLLAQRLIGLNVYFTPPKEQCVSNGVLQE